MQKVLHLDAEKCTGCLQCEMACSFENYGVYAPAKSRIKVFDFHATGKKVPYTCTQCDEAWCLHACPVEACPTAAITYIDANWTGLDRMKQWADKLGNQPSAV